MVNTSTEKIKRGIEKKYLNWVNEYITYQNLRTIKAILRGKIIVPSGYIKRCLYVLGGGVSNK